MDSYLDSVGKGKHLFFTDICFAFLLLYVQVKKHHYLRLPHKVHYVVVIHVLNKIWVQMIIILVYF